MALDDTKTPYEILIRYGIDGQPKGAHCRYLRRVVLDGEVLKEEEGPPEPLELAGFPTSAIMSDTARNALSRVSSLEAENNAMRVEIEAGQNLIQQLTGENASLSARVRELEAKGSAATAPASEEMTE